MLAMLAVVGCFAATVTFGQLRLRPIREHALEIIDDAVPGIVQLSALESELLRIGLRLNEAVDEVNVSPPALRVELVAMRRRIDDGIAAYQRLPTSAIEMAKIDTVVADLALLDEASVIIVHDLERGSAAAGDEDLRKLFDPRLRHAAEDIGSLRELNSDIVTARAQRMGATYHDALDIVRLCGATSLLVAILATLLVIRVLRGRTRLLEERDLLLAERATELEAFAGRIAHDLRNPLSVFCMRVMTVQQRTDLPVEARDQLGKAARQVDRMSGMIDGMLEFARAGANPTPDARASVKEVLDDALADLAAAVEAGTAAIDVAPFADVAVASTRAAVGAALGNLLSNAVKYGRGSTGHAVIAVRVTERERRVRVEVGDRGPGIPADAHALVFEPFRQLSGSHTGIGLGLATVKKAIEASGGTVGVDSTLGHGATFWFELPKARR